MVTNISTDILMDVMMKYRCTVLDRDIDRVSTDIVIDVATNVSLEAPHKIHDPA